MAHKVLFIVETGWRGMREASLELLRQNYSVDMVIKGDVAKDILDIIGKPKGLVILAMSRLKFVVYLIFYLLWHKICGSVERVIVSKERTRGWVGAFGIETKILIETENGYELK